MGEVKIGRKRGLRSKSGFDHSVFDGYPLGFFPDFAGRFPFTGIGPVLSIEGETDGVLAAKGSVVFGNDVSADVYLGSGLGKWRERKKRQQKTYQEDAGNGFFKTLFVYLFFLHFQKSLAGGFGIIVP